MGKFIKYLFYTILTLILLVVIGVSVLIYTFNPNILKAPIAQQVKAQTGRTMTINGNISWRFFPWLGLNIQGIQLSNASNFDQTSNFLSLKSANVDIKVLPLLSGNIEIGKISLDGLKLNLVTNAQGQNDWSDLSKASPGKPVAVNSKNGTPSTSKFKLDKLQISSIDISNASVSYNNLQTKQKYLLQNLNLTSQNISLNSAFPITTSFEFNSSSPNIYGQLSIDTKFDLNQSTQTYTVSPFVLNATLNGAQFPKNGLTINLQTAATLNKPNATLDISKLVGKIANMQFDGKIGGVDIFKSPTFNGYLTVSSFNPKTFLQTLGIAAPNFQNKNAFSKVSINTQFVATPTVVAINDLKLALDQSTLTGNIKLALNKAAQSQFNLNVDKINLSNYLTAPTNSAATPTAATPSPSQATAAAAQMLPVQQLRQLNLTGKLAIGTLNYQKFQMTNVALNIAANNGLVRLAPNTANLYQGQWQSNIALNVQSNTPIWQINEVLNNVQVAPLTNAFYENKKYQVTGTGSIKMSLNTSGNTTTAITQNLNGSGQFALTNGVVKGIDLGHQMKTAMALVNKQAAPSNPNNNQTPFGSLTGTVQINNGVLTNNDLSLKSPALQVTGKGTVNLPSQQVQYQVQSSAIQGQVDPKIYALQEKIGGSIPIIIAGSFNSLKVYPDIEAILKNMAAAYVKQNSGKIQQAVDKQVQKIGGKLLNKNLQNALQNGLGSLLKQ